MDDQPFISVIVPVWNSPVEIAKCLAAIGAQTYPRDRHEVIVVDNGSTDETAKIARSFPFVTLLSEPVASSYRARNLGLKVARGDYVAFTDADCIPDPDWLSAAARAALQSPNAGVLAGHIDLFRANAIVSDACEKYERIFLFDQARNANYGFCDTANWMSQRKTLLDFGGFNADLKSGADWKLSKRIWANGRAIVYVPEMRVRHPLRASLEKLMARRRRMVGGLWHDAKSRWRFLWCSAILIRRFGSRMKATLLDRRLSLTDKLKVSYVVIILSAIGVIELVHLANGSEPRRA
jgi:glycosyltransferase involved in cell wall biosynthesis